jgi:LDH2 family malate/lactate/ureidoglycolate dehydrogenase
MLATPRTEYHIFPAPDLREFGAACFRAAGMAPEDASLASALLVRSEMRGVETHGVQWFSSYCRSLRAGRINPTPSVAIVTDFGALLAVDGDSGLGHVVSTRAMGWCVERARTVGAAFAVVRNSRHSGAASLYALQAMEAGYIGLSTTGGGVRVTPAGGREALLGTNPIAFAAPCGPTEPPFVLDMATSVVAGAKVNLHALKGLPIPLGWGLDPEGYPTTDAAAAARGSLLPLGSSLELGSYKGFGLNLMVETLCHALAGVATGPERVRNIGTAGGGEGHFLGAIRIEGFQSADDFRAQMDRTLQTLRASAPMEGVDRIYTPGELEWNREGQAAEQGVRVLAQTVRALDDLAAELGVEPLYPHGA